MAVALLIGLLACRASAVPITPTRDDEVIERLPAVSVRNSNSSEPALALREAQALLDASRKEGDPRLAGRALARLARWSQDPQAPAEVLLLLASAEQYLHQFDRATARLQALVQRDPRQAQAWLVLATMHRVRGRYADSDAACRALLSLRAQPYADGCVVENLALRGEHDAARRQLQALIAAAADASIRGWLLTTLAELEQRAGRVQASEQAWRRALQAVPDSYTSIGYADFLLDNQRPREAWRVLQPQVRTDPVMLRLAIAAQRAGMAQATVLQAELRERFALADQRTESSGHERERAMMALEIERDPAAALRVARRNVEHQREPLDVLLLARCAAAAKDDGARNEARQLARTMGLRDARLDAL
ncbi:hypothetical protein [Aquabacterium sp.]|uniref:hypothetical protein n=1 Tax=Aquabacterium sp. TaxID=1872578 RepID=UPI002B91C304|nr:hypothetical protein [Aquabacterium sp.]HSW07510.1 hypothetical protein [Aquabacterium sp.]